MSQRDELPTTGDMLGEILDLVTGAGVMLLPALILAVPGLILLVPLALLAIPFAILAAPFLLIYYVRRLMRRPRKPSSQASASRSRVRAAGTA
jgi:membrane protein implicated in regulation of membrane protease activity